MTNCLASSQNLKIKPEYLCNNTVSGAKILQVLYDSGCELVGTYEELSVMFGLGRKETIWELKRLNRKKIIHIIPNAGKIYKIELKFCL